MNSMDDWLVHGETMTALGNYYRFAVTDRHVVVSMPNAKAECFDRQTGRSLWLYSFPGFNYERWVVGDLPRYRGTGWGKFGHDTYTSEYSTYAKSLSPQLQTPTTVTNSTTSVTARIIIDPDPLVFPRAVVAPFIAWLLPVYCLWLLLRNIRPRNWKESERAFWSAVKALVLGIVAYIALGRYSLPTLIAILTVTAMATVLSYHFWRHSKRMKMEEDGRKHLQRMKMEKKIPQ